VLDCAKVALFMGTDRPHVPHQAIHCCRNFGIVSIVAGGAEIAAASFGERRRGGGEQAVTGQRGV